MVKISYYDLDRYGRLKFSALLRMVHIAADENASELGIGYAQLAPLGISFVLQRFSAAATRLPVYGEEVAVRTWPAAVARGLFTRKGEMRDTHNEKIMEWASLWLLFDLNARKILKPTALPVTDTATLLQGDQGAAIEPEKIIIADFDTTPAPHFAYPHTVRYADTDTNAHMNNAIYGDLVGNATFANLPNPAPWTRLDINYQAEARPADIIQVNAWQAGNKTLVMGESAARTVFTARVEQAVGRSKD